MSETTRRWARRRIVVTGGPGAGKTAVLEIARRDLVPRISVLPESASIVFGGGFPRESDPTSRRAAQRAIYHVQRELEELPSSEHVVSVCDRGTIDTLAYWPGRVEEFFGELGTSLNEELARYSAVVHLRVPDDGNGYHGSPLRIESAREAKEIDARLLEVWAGHPRRVIVDTDADFLLKAHRALGVLRKLMEES